MSRQFWQPDREFWWEMLPAVPRRNDSHAYQRLRRVWFDHTVANHPFLSQQCEDHLSATLFENFVLFDPQEWLAAFCACAGMSPPEDRLITCDWGYQVQDETTTKMADVGIHARGPGGDCAILVEAKAKDGSLKKQDVDPGSYLELAEFARFECRYLVYLVDERDLSKIKTAVIDQENRAGFLTWQRLGGLQIQLALNLNCEERIRDFVAGAIQYQYLTHSIRPSTLVADYLVSEPSRSEIHKLNPDKMKSWRSKWRLD